MKTLSSEDMQNDNPGQTSRFITMPTRQIFERLSCCLPLFQRLHLNDLITELKDFKKLNQTHETSFFKKLRLLESVPILAHANRNMISATA